MVVSLMFNGFIEWSTLKMIGIIIGVLNIIISILLHYQIERKRFSVLLMAITGWSSAIVYLYFLEL